MQTIDAPAAMTEPSNPQISTTQSPGTVLLVDDEANILTSLKRLFRPTGYRILTAEGGQEGLAILEQEAIDVVVSDMRMPQMSGAEFLQHVRARKPEVVRILLTGFADITSTIEAINKGEIFRYIAKPWDDREMLLIVKQALDTKRLLEEKRQLEALIQQQNEELKELNTGLEHKVQERTKELQQTMQFLEKAHTDLKKSFVTSIKVFSNLIEMREGSMAGHSRRVADMARNLANHLKMRDNEAQDIFLAALLHDIGKIGLPDGILKKPYAALTQEERELVHKHPIKGQSVLMALEQLNGAAVLIRHHHERFDGQGYPDALSGLSIPIGARILTLVNDFDGLVSGTLEMRKYTQEQALQEVRQHAGKRYDPTLVKALAEMMGHTVEKTRGHEIELRSGALAVGMALSRDLITRDGVLLLAKDYMLDQRIIEQIRHYEAIDGRVLSIFIYARK